MADRNEMDWLRRDLGPAPGPHHRSVRGTSGYGWGYEDEGTWDATWGPRPDRGRPDAWGGAGYGTFSSGAVEHAWEPGGRYEAEAPRRQTQQGLGRPLRGGGGAVPGYGGFSPGDATTGYHGYGEGRQGGTFEGADPGFGGYGTGGGGYTPSRGGGTSGLGGNTGRADRTGFWEGPHTGRGPQGWRRTDQSLYKEACEILTRHGQVDASRIRLTVENGEITLEGKVGSRREKRLAEDALDRLYGVKDVHNRLRVQEEREG